MASNTRYTPKFLNYRVTEVPDPTLYNDGENVDPSCDTSGATLVSLVTNVIPPAPATFGILNDFAAEGDFGTIELTTVNGFNPSENAIYVQFFTAAPAPLATPDINCFLVPAGGSFSWTPTFPLAGGDWEWRVSSTPNVFTADATAIWIHAEGRTL